MEGLNEALQQEVKGFGIRVTLIEPNVYATDFFSSAVQSASCPAYDQIKAELATGPAFDKAACGVPEATVDALFAVVDSPNPPLHFFMGNVGLNWTKYFYALKIAEWEAWKEISDNAQGK
jgi:hypothetical protein